MDTTPICLAQHRATTLWNGDVAVLGATYAGINAAAAAARLGHRVCLVEPGPTLGTEVSQFWDTTPPSGWIRERLQTLCREAGAADTGQLDVFLSTLACDHIVAETGAHALVRVVPLRALSDAEGLLQGVEVVGRSGRQAILAPRVLDALPGRPFTRRTAGLALRAALAVRRRLYVAGLELPAPAVWHVDAALGVCGDQVRVIPGAWCGEALVQFDMANDAGQSAHTMTQASLNLAVDVIAWLKANRPECAAITVVDISPANEPVFAPQDNSLAGMQQTGLLPLPEDAAGSQSESLEEVLHATLTTRSPLPRPVSLPPGTTCLESSELSADPAQDLAPFNLPKTAATLHEPTDLVVAGYGTGGAIAALAAAAEGLRVTVLDPAAVPGGIGTAGRIHSYYHGLKGGLQDGVDEIMAGKTAAISEGVRGFHPVAKAAALATVLQRPNITLLPGHTVFGVIRNGDRVEALLSAADDGYHVFPCQVSIDSTGDGDVCAAAGAPMTLGREGDGFPQPYSYTPSLMREGILHHANFDAGWVDPSDTLDLSRAHFEGRQRLWERRPFSNEAHFCTLASVLGIRESRFLDGDPSLSFADFMEGRTYPDTVCSSAAHYDNHAMDYAEESEWGRRHVALFGLWRYPCHGDIPFRAFVPRGVNGLLMACRALAVDHDLHQLVRMQRDIQVFGEICGLAAAMAVKQGVAPAEIDVADLKQRLEKRGITPRPSAPVMDRPAAELLELLLHDGDERGLAMWRLSTKTGDQGDFWPDFFAAEHDDTARFAGALAAALGGHDLPDVRAILNDTIERRVGDPLGIKAPPRCVAACLALAALGAPESSAAIGGLLQEDSLGVPEVLLLLRALAQTPGADAADIIRSFLATHADNDWAIPLWGVREGSNTSFRPAVDLRAWRSLAALGAPPDPFCLQTYCTHEMLLLRKYARRVAQEIEAARH